MTYSHYGSYSSYSHYSKYGYGGGHSKPSYTTYEFTAFSKDDLFGSDKVGCGTKFELPASATTCISVSDDDSSLSGDCYDQATDCRGQQAQILDGNGNDSGNGGQIYAEQYHWVVDQDGYWYVLIEIEQEGSNESYFTFHSAYGVPPAGACLTVKSTCNVSGDWLKYDDLGAGDSCVPTGSITGTAWCDDCDGIQEFETTITKGDPIFTHSVTYESVTCTQYNVDCYGDWRSTGCDTIDIVVGKDQGHYGNAKDNTIVELDKGGIWSRDFKVDMAGTYCLSFDTYYNSCAGKYGNSFDVVINGQVVETVKVTKDGKIELSVELKHGYNEIEFVSKSYVSGYGAGIDDVNFQQLIETTTRAEPVKEGILIKLLHADGSPVLDGNGQEIVTYTDADGNYRFDDVPVGDYKIMGVAPDGSKFTIQDAGSDDSIDSDVDENGMSGVIKVTADGEADVDLGLCPDPNEDPIAVDDTAKGCADELILATNLLANDTDSDGDILTITSIFDADETAGVGESITLADGAIATLNADGTVTIDGIAAYADLTIGSKAYDSFSYTVSDGQGGSASADVDVTFCGALNTIDTIAAYLDGTQVTFEVQNVTVADFGEAYTVDLIASTSANIPLGLYDAAYCIDGNQPISLGVQTNATVYVATEASVAAMAPDVNAENIDSVVWLLNNDYTAIDNGDGTGDTYTDLEVQEAIWSLMNGDTFYINAFANPELRDNQNGVRDGAELATLENVQEIVDAALMYGDGFVAGEGDVVGLLLDPTEPVEQEQPFIIGVDFNNLMQDCLC